jgi:hypothetical protein
MLPPLQGGDEEVDMKKKIKILSIKDSAGVT